MKQYHPVGARKHIFSVGVSALGNCLPLPPQGSDDSVLLAIWKALKPWFSTQALGQSIGWACPEMTWNWNVVVWPWLPCLDVLFGLLFYMCNCCTCKPLRVAIYPKTPLGCFSVLIHLLAAVSEWKSNCFRLPIAQLDIGMCVSRKKLSFSTLVMAE